MRGPSFALRDVAPTDADAIATLFLAARRTAMPWLAVVHTDQETRRWVGDVLLRDGAVRVADIAGAAVGFAAVKDGWLDHLYVAPDHQGIGVGSRLLDDAKRIAGAALQLYVFQRNRRARDFYLRHGFVEVAFGDGSGNEEREPDLVMRWPATR
ncbi:MAG TPA: GNAT family N-acetyltransferase [Vineibacter sp.]|nr:GNAT family N-acetyltransferase [Vineibacter sp.]